MNTSRHFEYKDDKSSKFWEITQADSTVTVRFGKTGTQGQTQEKGFADAAAAAKHAAKLIAEKTAKGYVERGAQPSGSAPSDSAAREPETQPAPAIKAARPSKAAKPTKPKSPTQDPEGAPESLFALLDKDDATNRLLARHPKASAELLEKFSHSGDKITREAVARHANTPAEVFVRLAQQFPKAFLANPQLDLLLLENPALLSQLPEATLARLLKLPECPAALLTWAAEHRSEKLQLAVAMNAQAPQDAREALARSQHPSVLEASPFEGTGKGGEKLHPDQEFQTALRERLQSLSGGDAYGAWDARDIGLPQWPYLSPTVRAYVLSFEYEALIKSPYLPVAVWEELLTRSAEYTPLMLCDLAFSPVAAAEKVLPLLQDLALHGDPEVRAAIAGHPQLPKSALHRMLEDTAGEVVDAAAANPALSVDELMSLAGSRSERIRAGVAKNPSAPSQVIAQLLRDASSEVRAHACSNLNAPAEECFEAFALLCDEVKEMDGYVAEELACILGANPRATPTQLAALSGIETYDLHLFEVIARNPSAPAALRKAIAKKRDVEIKVALASNPATDPVQLSQMVLGADQEARVAALANPSTPDEVRRDVLDQLFGKHPSPVDNVWLTARVKKVSSAEVSASSAKDVGFFCGKDPNKTALAKRPMAAIMALSAGPFVEPSRIAKLVTSNDWLVRAAVARNSGTPPNLLTKLRGDAHGLVARLATSSVQRIEAQEGLASNRGSVIDEQQDFRRAIEEVVNRHSEPRVDACGRISRLFKDEFWSRHLNGAHVALLTVSGCADLPHLSFSDVQRSFAFRQAALLEMARTLLRPDEYAFLLEGAVFGEKALDSSATTARQWVAREATCPRALLQQLAQDDDPAVVLAALGNPALPPEDLDRARTRLSGLRGKRLLDLLANADAPTECLVANVKSKDWQVRRAVAGNPSVTAPLLEVLATDDKLDVLCAVAGNPSAPSVVLSALSKNRDEDVRRAIAANSAASASVLEALSKSRDVWVHMAIAKNPSASTALRQRLLTELAAKPDDLWTGATVAESSETPLAVLESWANDELDSRREAVAKHPSTSSATLAHLSSDKSLQVRIGAAGNAAMPALNLEVLAKDDDKKIRLAVAKNPSTPLLVRASLLSELSTDAERNIRIAIAADPATPSPVLQRLATDPLWWVRLAVIGNSSAPQEIREAAFSAWHERVRRAMQREMAVRVGRPPEPQSQVQPADLLRALDWLDLVHPNDDNKALTKASRSKDWLTRLGAALHPEATEGILKILRQDNDLGVAQAATRDALHKPRASQLPRELIG